MKRRDIEYNIDEIKKLLADDPLERNKNLEAMMTFINKLDDQLVLNLDDNWGAGKTVFLKQLEYLGNHTETNENINGISKAVMDEFNSKMEVFYYNSWEQDLYDEPLESLIFNLLMKVSDSDKDKVKLTELMKKIGVIGSQVAINFFTKGQLELSDLSGEEDKKIKKISSIEEKREAVKDLIDTILGDSDKKLLIIIDELDRCKPTYAVELLEIIKHFFKDSNVVFLFSSNKNELSETIRKLYGNNFDGYKYLNRFFDFEFKLPIIDIDKYLKYKYHSKFDFRSTYYPSNMIEVSKYFNFSMRDCDRYLDMCIHMSPFWKNVNNRYDSDKFTEYVLLPYIIGLKLYDGRKYNEFLSGKGEAEFLQFCNRIEKLTKRFFESNNNHSSTPIEYSEEIMKRYQNFYDIISGSVGINTVVEEQYSVELIIELLSMMSMYTS